MLNKFKSWFQRSPLGKKKKGVLSHWLDKLRGRVWDETVRDDLQKLLLQADVGTFYTDKIVEQLMHGRQDAEPLLKLRDHLVATLRAYEPKPMALNAQPEVVVIVGVNGAGKTTTIGKLAYHFRTSGKKVMVAAGDTFRAAAVEQLAVLAELAKVPLIRQAQGADSAAVIYDAYQSAKAKKYDLLLADTAGRLHTKEHLLDELAKIIRVLAKLDEKAPQHVWLVLDGTLGQSSLEQAKVFRQHLPVTGMIMTKLDGSAKGGSLIALTQELDCPVVAVGTGEGLQDWAPFSAKMYADALLELVDDSTE